jgi:phage/plasmid-like protein (TIGR03299 family)
MANAHFETQTFSEIHDAGTLFFDNSDDQRGYGGRYGTDIGSFNSLDEAAAAVPGFTDRVAKVPVMAVLSGAQANAINPENDPDEPFAQEWKGKFATMNERTGALYGFVTDSYEVCQWDSAFAVPRILEERGEATFDAAGVLRGGAKTWMTMKLGEMTVQQIDGSEDVSEQFLFFSNSHTGHHSVSCGLTSHRIACNNALPFVNRTMRSKMTMRHSASLEQRLAEAQAIILNAPALFAEAQDEFQRMARTRMSRQEMRDFTEDLLDDIKGKTDDTRGQRAALVDELLGAYDEGNQGAGETTWGAYQTVTGWLDHKLDQMEESRRTANKIQTHWESVNTGSIFHTKKRALKTLLSRR